MATLADTIDLISGTFSITLETAPEDGAGSIATGKPKFVTTDSNGAFSTTLNQGSYTVRIPNTPAFSITVPSGSSTYDFEDVYAAEGYTAPSRDSVFATVALFMDSDTTAQIVWIDATGASADQDGGFFKRGGSGTHDAVNVIVRDDGQTYTRIGA